MLEIKGLDKVIAKLEKMTDIPEKADKILYELAKIGEKELENAYSERIIDTRYDRKTKEFQEIDVTPKITTDVIQYDKTTELIAEGEELLYLEFGAGIKHNNPREWENILDIPVPLEVADIGTRGKGLGSNEAWYYSRGGITSIRSEGIKARGGFARAINEIYANVDRIIEEVLDE